LTPFSNDDERWAAVVRGDRDADGAFFSSVLTTGVYCRPSCPARLPRRENVSFYASCKSAEKSGFRACRRCRPNEPPLAERRAYAISHARALIEKAEQMPNLDVLAASAGMSRFHFHRVFKIVMGVTPRAYANACSAQRLQDELPQHGASLGASPDLNAKSSQVIDGTVTKSRSTGIGEPIRVAFGLCSLGSILIASTDKGICAIQLGDDPHSLIRDLQDSFPKANFICGGGDIEHLVAEIVGFVETPTQSLVLPLDVRGTAFQKRVWQAVCEIPAGLTRSYADIAKQIKVAKAIHAVSQACMSNMIALAIPCHRVVRSDGGLSGYPWGVERKRALLRSELSSQSIYADQSLV
jgi:AraC family transcriptional regulator of adaptative response/methylated-DNA-[protein]-cysteine methyltransferase